MIRVQEEETPEEIILRFFHTLLTVEHAASPSGAALVGLGFIGELQQTRPLHDVGEEHELGLIGTENFAHQHEA